MEHTFRLLIEVYGYSIYIIYTDNIEESRLRREKELGRMKKRLGKYVDGMHSYKKSEPDCAVFITPKSSCGTVAHEAYHAVRRMLKYIGAKQDNEIVAYHLGYVVDHINAFTDSCDQKEEKLLKKKR